MVVCMYVYETLIVRDHYNLDLLKFSQAWVDLVSFFSDSRPQKKTLLFIISIIAKSEWSHILKIISATICFMNNLISSICVLEIICNGFFNVITLYLILFKKRP